MDKLDRKGAQNGSQSSGQGLVDQEIHVFRHGFQKTTRPQQRFYIPVGMKFVLVLLLAAAWAAISVWLSRPWYGDLSVRIGTVPAAFLIGGIAIVPGFMNAFLVASLLLDRRPPRAPLAKYPAVSILIAAYNEAANIAETLKSIAASHYPGTIQVIVIDDGSQDATAAIVTQHLQDYPWLQLIRQPKNSGKANALNAGLALCEHDLVITIDADSYLYHDALTALVERFLLDPPSTRAVAGSVLVRNSRENWVTRAQEWDYFHGIASIKRAQSLFQGTLVAQGAFSIYCRHSLQDVGGWPNCVGEDIVLSWALLKRGYRIGYCEDACLFTNAPTTVRQFVRQRQRWSRGVIEGFKSHPSILFTPRMSTLMIYWNLLFPLLDLVFTCFFLPGLLLALAGYFWIAGPMTLALLPMALLINALMYSKGKHMFDQQGLHVRRNPVGFFIYAFAYSMVLQPACVVGYAQELVSSRKSWGTK